MSPKQRLLPTTLLPLLLPALANAYSWNFQATPQQCSNLTINIDGTDGKPPYRILILPFGPSPLPNNIEARKIMDMPFDGDATSLSFQLKYPANSQFVAVVSDTSGFGSGGTSVAATVTDSSDSSCFDSSKSVAPLFPFNIFPVNQIVQCQDTRLWWDGTDTSIQGIPIFQGVIPGGQSFTIPRGQITNVTGQGTGFTWKPNVRSGTTLFIVGGDNRGNGTAGSTSNLVGAGINNDGSCLSNSSPSSTPGSPAGGSYPTSTDGSGNGVGTGGGGSKSNVGAIVGGVIGGVAALIILALILLFFKRRQRVHRRQKERPVDLLNADEDGDESPSGGPLQGRNDLPQYYEPEPFLVPDPTSNDGHTLLSSERPLSASSVTASRSGTPDLMGYAQSATTTTTRKGGAPRPLRPVNIIQHDDAGPSAADLGETIELPPAYTNIKKSAASTPPTEETAPPPPAEPTTTTTTTTTTATTTPPPAA